MTNSNENTNKENAHLIPKFRHVPGVHCTSSAIRDVFEFQGFNISEAMVFGLGSGLGLSYGKIGSKNPIIGGRQYKFEDNLCKILNIKLNKFQTTSKEEGWLRLKSMLENNTPAVINVDMAYLSYQELPEDFHFGQHAVVIAGYNPEKSTVLIADTQFPDRKEISLEDLDSARNSTYDRWMDPRNFIYEFTFTESLPDLKEVIPNAIRKNGKNLQKKSRMMRILGMTNGIDAIIKFSQSLEMLPTLTDSVLHERCDEITGFISEYGTGGGLFRYLFSQFLDESAEICNEDSLIKLGEYYKSLGDKWEEVSQSIQQIPESTDQEKNQLVRIIMDILNKIKIFELKGAQKLQDYSG
ncbi:MAG: BtrH N-terminal domain-containing protein [Candidatus Hodarchaeales archaeon]